MTIKDLKTMLLTVEVDRVEVLTRSIDDVKNRTFISYDDFLVSKDIDDLELESCKAIEIIKIRDLVYLSVWVKDNALL